MLTVAVGAGAQVPATSAVADTLQQLLPELEVKGREWGTGVPDTHHARVRWNVDALSAMPQVLGNADPMRYSQMLPGVQTNNEYDSGLHIYGCDNSHNMVSVHGVPIYNASHLLGLFSTFNPSHYQLMSITKTASDAAFPNRLGGLVDMEPATTVADTVSGQLSVGLIASQGTLRLPLGRKSMLIISGRASYVNLLYGYALKNDGEQLRYSFADANATWLWTPTAADRVWVDAYWGGDRAWMAEDRYQALIKLRWGNAMLAGHWHHRFAPSSTMRHTVYFTRFANRFSLDYPALSFALPSSVADVGYRGSWQGRHIRAGLDVAVRHVHPQSPEVAGTYNTRNTGGNVPAVFVQEYSPYGGVLLPLWPGVLLQAGVRGTLYRDGDGHCHWSADPSLSLSLSRSRWECSLTAAMRHQHLFQTGFSSMGLPTEFWLPADRGLKPQRALSLSATVAIPIDRLGIKVELEAYYKRLSRLVEYSGTVLDFLNTDYRTRSHLLQGSGDNYGATLMVSKTRGRLTGWVSYSLGRAMRHFAAESLRGHYPARHERIHEFNALVSFELSRHWSLSATAVCASGTPFTSVGHLYVFAGHVVSQFGDYNASRLKPYARLDLAAVFKWWSRGGREQGVNLSVYNALANKNELFHSWRVTRDGKLNYQSVSFLVRVMPSVSYYVKF